MILHTSDGGTSWKEALRYRRWPAPLFYLAAASAFLLLVWSAVPVSVINRSLIEELVSSDAPVTDIAGCGKSSRAA